MFYLIAGLMAVLFQVTGHHHWISEGVGMGIVVQWVFSAFVSSMPPLPPNANYWAQWGYAGLHALAANIDKLKMPVNGASSTKQEG